MINVVGAGSLGSFCVFLLAKMIGVLRCPIVVTDFDKVELHNVQNQLYRESDVGRLKVEALRDIVKDTFNVDLVVTNGKADQKSDLRGIVIIQVDNMKARQSIFEACKFNSAVDYFIDVRTGENEALVFAFDPKYSDWVKRYQLMLYPDVLAQAPPCATSETVPVLWTAAAVVAKLVLNFKKSKVFTNEFYQATIDFEKWPSVIPEVQKEI